MRRVIALALLLGLPWASVGSAGLAPFKATYAIRASGMAAGTGELHLQQSADGSWTYSLQVQPRGLARFVPNVRQRHRSVFRIIDGRVRPDSFNAEETEERVAFDWTSGRVTGTVGRRNFDLPTQPGLLDSLSVQVALMQELMSDRMPSRFVLVDEGRIKEYLYSVEGSEVIDSVAGKHRADIFSSRRPGSRKATFYWSAPELGYIPLKVERRNGRDVEVSMTLTSLERR